MILLSLPSNNRTCLFTYCHAQDFGRWHTVTLQAVEKDPWVRDPRRIMDLALDLGLEPWKKLSFKLILAGFSQCCCSRFSSDVQYCHSGLVLCKKPQRQGNTLNRHQSILRSLDEECSMFKTCNYCISSDLRLLVVSKEHQ